MFCCCRSWPDITGEASKVCHTSSMTADNFSCCGSLSAEKSETADSEQQVMTHCEQQTWHLTNDLDCVLQEVFLQRPSYGRLSSALTFKTAAVSAPCYISYICNTTGIIIRLPEGTPLLICNS